MSEKVYARIGFRKVLDAQTVITAIAEIHSYAGQAPYFSLTGEIKSNGIMVSGGRIDEQIAEHFPHLAKFLKWNLTSTEGPMHYVANTVYHAGDRDYNGLRKGEVRQIRNGKTGIPAWHMVVLDADGNESDVYKYTHKSIDADEQPANPNLRIEWRPWNRVGEGKDRDLDAARQTAVWLDATDEQLMAEPAELKAALEARLPALLEEFKRDMAELFSMATDNARLDDLFTLGRGLVDKAALASLGIIIP